MAVSKQLAFTLQRAIVILDGIALDIGTLIANNGRFFLFFKKNCAFALRFCNKARRNAKLLNDSGQQTAAFQHAQHLQLLLDGESRAPFLTCRPLRWWFVLDFSPTKIDLHCTKKVYDHLVFIIGLFVPLKMAACAHRMLRNRVGFTNQLCSSL